MRLTPPAMTGRVGMLHAMRAVLDAVEVSGAAFRLDLAEAEDVGEMTRRSVLMLADALLMLNVADGPATQAKLLGALEWASGAVAKAGVAPPIDTSHN